MMRLPQRTGPRILLLCAGILALATTAAGQQVIIRQGQVLRAGVAPKPEAAFLINADPELATYLSQAQEFAQAGEYAKALDILQALLNKTGSTFVSAGDGHRYVSLAEKVDEVLAHLPPEALELYRQLNDAQARRLMNEADAARDQAALAQLAQRYRRSSVGGEMLRRLGALQFDAAQFAPAQRSFEQALALVAGPAGETPATRVAQLPSAVGPVDADKPLLLARVAVSAHLAGDARAAQAAADALAKEYPQAKATLAGVEQNVAQYVTRIRASATSRPVQSLVEEWLSFSGSATGLAVSPPTQPVLSPQWIQPEGKVETNPVIRLLVGMTGDTYAPAANVPNVPGRAMQTRKDIRIVEGQVIFTLQQEGQPHQALLPPVLHVLATGQMILCRDTRGVCAYDIASGQLAWRTLDFPIYARMGAGLPMDYRYIGVSMQDEGLFRLSSGEHLVFAVGNFPPRDVRSSRMIEGDAPNRMNSCLAAFSISQQGKQVWKIGGGAGDSDIVRSCAYLTAPTYADGKLFVIVRFRQAYHLLCLRASDGKSLYSQLISQQPPEYERNPLTPELTTPPAVNEGKVFALTNAGVLACFQADTGSPLWAYQYDSAGVFRNLVIADDRGRQTPMAPRGGTAMVATDGPLICLPADSQSVLAFDEQNGQLLWQKPRGNQVDLTALDSQRIALSSPNLIILKVADGSVLWSGLEQVRDVLGRPVVTSDALLLSGKGRIFRVDLKDYAVTTLPLRQSDSPLGNLVSYRGKLIASSAAGVALYSTYEQARAELSQRIEKASGLEKLSLLYQRGTNAFHAGQMQEALTDLQAVEASRDNPAGSALAAKTHQTLGQAYVALGNAATGSEQLDWFTRAQAVADEPRTRGEMLLRLARHFEQNGKLAQAVETTQKLSQEMADVPMCDYGIGSSAATEESAAPPANGYQAGHALIAEFIQRHGQEAYEAYDQKASDILQQAAKTQDVESMVRLAQQYRHSVHAPMALLQAAQIQYTKALDQATSQRRDLLGKSGVLLQQIIREYSDSGLAASAQLGMVMIYQQVNPRLAHLAWEQIGKLPRDTQMAFAGMSGTVGSLEAKFQPVLPAPQPVQPPRDLKLPLAMLWSGPATCSVLLDAHGDLLQWRDCFFILLQDGSIYCSQAGASDWTKSILWNISPLEAQGEHPNVENAGGRSPALYGELSGETLVIVYSGRIVGLNLRDGHEAWSKEQPDLQRSSEMGLRTSTDKEIVALGNNGFVYVLSKSTGAMLWQHRVPFSQLPWRDTPQAAGGLLLTFHGQGRTPQCTVFDLTSRRSLGRVAMNYPARLTNDGLLIGTYKNELLCIEPVLQMDRPLWKVTYEGPAPPMLLEQDGDNVFITRPQARPQVVEMRSISQFGRKIREFTLPGEASAPITRGEVLADRLLLTAGNTLHAFDVKSGTALWSSSQKDRSFSGMAVTQNQAFLRAFEQGAKPVPCVVPLDLRDGKSGPPLICAEVKAGDPVPQRQMSPAPYCAVAGERLVTYAPRAFTVWAPSATSQPASNPSSAPAGQDRRP